MWEISLWLFVFLFAINGFMYFLNDVFPDYTIINPFTNTTMALATQPNPYTTLTSINGTTEANATAGGPAVSIWDTFNYGWNGTIFLYNLVTGGFVFQVIAALIPASGSTLIIFGVIQGVVAFFLVLTGVHFLRAIF